MGKWSRSRPQRQPDLTIGAMSRGTFRDRRFVEPDYAGPDQFLYTEPRQVFFFSPTNRTAFRGGIVSPWAGDGA